MDMQVKEKKTLKRAAIMAGAILGIGAAIYGGLVIYRKSSRKPVRVYPASQLAVTADMIGAQTDQYYGTVAASNIQTVYLSGTEEVKNVYVQEGQGVKAGDPLIAYDTTLSAIKVERADNDLKKQKLSLSKAQDELTRLLHTNPVSSGDGGFQSPAGDGDVSFADEYYGGYGGEYGEAESGAETFYPEEKPEKEKLQILSGAGTLTDPYVVFIKNNQEISEDQLKALFVPGSVEIGQETMPVAGGEHSSADEETISEVEEPPEEKVSVSENSTPEEGTIYVIFREFAGDNPGGTVSADNGMRLVMREGKLSYTWMRLETPNEPGGDDDPGDWNDEPGDDPGSEEKTYTKEELARALVEKRKEIRDLTLKIKLAELELREMKEEVSDGVVRSKFDGIVKTVRNPDDAYKSGKPIVTVTAGSGGYYVQVDVGEFSLSKIREGETMSITDMQEGSMFDGTVEKVSDIPSTGNMGWSGGNPNVSYYIATVKVSGDAEMKEQSYVMVSPAETEENGEESLYIDAMMVRKDEGQPYIFVLGKDGSLVRRNVITGKNMYGYYEIRRGLHKDDYIAFPYGPDVEAGAKTRKMDDVNSLYAGEEAAG